MTSFLSINVKPLSGYVGAEIDGINLKKISKEQFEEIKIAFGKHGVIFFEIKIYRPKKKLNLQNVGEK